MLVVSLRDAGVDVDVDLELPDSNCVDDEAAATAPAEGEFG